MELEKNSQTDTDQNRQLFADWIKVKIDLNFAGNYPAIKEGQVWWCGIGKNVGVEINGKNDTFARPIIILRKLNRYSFIAVPLTSQKHEGSWYASFIFKNKTEYAVLAQVRTLSVSRLYNKMGMLPASDLRKIKDALVKLIG